MNDHFFLISVSPAIFIFGSKILSIFSNCSKRALCVFCFPETHGKSLENIQCAFFTF